MRALLVCVWATGLVVAAGCDNNPYPPVEGDKKVIYSSISEDPHGLDPVQAGDTLSGGLVAQIYEPLYEYHYLKRPYELIPALAAEMPRVSDDGLAYTIPLKQGIHFQDDPCFEETGGEGREVTASDFVYSIKRLADMGNKPRGWWLLQEKVVGLDAFHERSVQRAADDRPMDYSLPVEGLQALDRYTLQIRLKRRFPQLRYVLAMSYTAAVPREAVRYYGDEFVNHPVGTGPFRLKEWSKRWRLVLEANPTYRADYYPADGEPADRQAGLLEPAGRRLPMVDRVHFAVIAESQPRWILFKQGYLDASGVSKDNFEEAITPERKLTEEFKQKQIELSKMVESVIYYVGFNMTDPVVGGDNDKLRKAMSLAYDTRWRIDRLYNGRAISAQSPVPPGIFGYEEDFQNPYKQYDVEKAKELLAEAGYPGGVGPDGERLTVQFDVGSPGQAAEQRAMAFRNDMQKIGIEVEIHLNMWAEFLRRLRAGALQTFTVGWILDYPDPENFLQLLYGPNKTPNGPNKTMYDDPEYNRLFERMRAMPNNEKRLEIIRRMRRIFVRDMPWIPGSHTVTYALHHTWLKYAKPHGITGGWLKYRDVDVEKRRELRRRWNRPNYALLGAGAAFVAAVTIGVALLARISSREVRR
ncbi:MAG: ABC transporter substrate-binding protein [Planctomycetota bacterium]